MVTDPAVTQCLDHLAHPDLQDFLVRRATKDIVVSWDQMASRDQRENKDPKGYKDHQVQEETRDQEGHVDIPETTERKEIRVQLDHQGREVQKENQANGVRWDLPEYRVKLEQEECQEDRDRKEIQGILDPRVKRVQLV